MISGTTAYDPRENDGDRDEQDRGSQVRISLLFPFLTMSTLCPLQLAFETFERRPINEAHQVEFHYSVGVIAPLVRPAIPRAPKT
jgi:hypothetical protein